MPSTYSTSLRLELMADGEKSGTWGTITNTNLGTLIEQGVAGVASVAHDDSASYTLTTNNGSSDEARNAVVLMTGALTADREVIVPDVDKVYIFKNGTSGGFALTFKTSGGSGVTIPNGRAAICYVDSGTGTVNAIDDGYFTDSIYIEGSSAGDFITAESTNAGATSGPDIKLYRNSASPADGDVLSKITFTANTDDGAGGVSVEDVEYASINVSAPETNETSGEAGKMVISLKRGGTTQNYIEIQGGTSSDADNDSIVFKTGGTAAITIDNSQDVTFSGAISGTTATFTTANNDPQLIIKSTDADASDGPVFDLVRDSASPADNDFIGSIRFRADDSAGNETQYADIRVITNDVTDGTEDGQFNLRTMLGGTLRLRLKADPSEVVFNEEGQDLDFRVESDTHTHALFVDGASGGVLIGDTAAGLGAGTPDAGRLVLQALGNSSQLNMYRADSTISGGDTLGLITAYSNDTNGNAIVPLVQIGMTADGNFSATDNPTKITFSTTPDASETMREVARFNNTGKFYTYYGAEINTDQVSNATGDFQVYSSSKTHMLFVDSSANGVGIGTSSVDHPLEVLTGANDKGIVLKDDNNDLVIIQRENEQFGRIRLLDATSSRIDISARGDQGFKTLSVPSIFNEDGGDNDFRVESDTNAHALFVDAGNSRIGLFNSSPSAPLHLIAGSSGGSLSDAIQISDSSYVNIAMYSGGADGEIRVGAAGVLRGAYKAQYAGTRSSNDFHVGVQDTTGMFTIDGAGSELIINERGAGTDFRVESDGNANAFFVDADQDTVHIGGSGGNYVANIYANTVNSPTGTLYVNAALNNSGRGVFIDAATRNSSEDSTRLLQVRDRHAYNALTVNVGGTVEINDDGGSWGDFRVESDNATHALFVDAGNDCVNIASTQTEALFGGGFPSSGYVKNFYKSEAIRTGEFPAGSTTPARTITIVVNMNAYRGACVKINTSGHLWNNGSAFYNRVNEIYLASEGTASRINSRVDILAAGSQIGQIGVPSASISATNQFSITQTVGAGYTANVFVEVTGMGYSSMGSISIA